MNNFNYLWHWRIVPWLRWPARILYRFRNSLAWARFGWGDHDWDHHYFFRMLEFKLERMAERFDRNYHVGAPREARRMRICAALCRRIMKVDYVPYGDDEFKPGGQPPIGPFKKWWEYEDYMLNQDIALLFDILRRNIRCWWD